MTEPTATRYPLRVRGDLAERPSRWLWLVKWLLLIPHLLVLAVLWVGVLVVSVVAFFSILFTRRYPEALFHYTVGVLRWTWRVGYYGYSALATDRYPPFSLESRADYPADLDLDPPGELSRGLVLVKWWLLALPHYLVLAVIAGGGWSRNGDGGDASWNASTSLLSLLVLFLGLTLLFAGRYPEGIHRLVMGVNRWSLRVAAYVLLLTDVYPPFRLDQGGQEPPVPAGGPAPGGDGPTTTTAGPADGHGLPAGSPAPAGGGARGAVALAVGVLLVVGGLGGLLAGGVAAGVDSRRDTDGYLSTPYQEFSTSTAALTSEGMVLDLSEGATGAVVRREVGTVRARVVANDSRPLFVGIARDEDVQAWLAGTAHDEVTGTDGDSPQYRRENGAVRAAADPRSQMFWAARADGTGELAVDWRPASGTWTLVIARADGSPGVQASAKVGAQLPGVRRFAIISLAGGLILLTLGSLLVVHGATHLGRRPPVPPTSPADSPAERSPVGAA